MAGHCFRSWLRFAAGPRSEFGYLAGLPAGMRCSTRCRLKGVREGDSRSPVCVTARTRCAAKRASRENGIASGLPLRRSLDRCRLSDCMDTSRFRRGNGTPTCSSTPKPIGPGRRLPAGTRTGPRLLAGATPTARAPRVGQPLHEHVLPATRTPALHFGAHGGRGRCVGTRSANPRPRRPMTSAAAW